METIYSVRDNVNGEDCRRVTQHINKTHRHTKRNSDSPTQRSIQTGAAQSLATPRTHTPKLRTLAWWFVPGPPPGLTTYEIARIGMGVLRKETITNSLLLSKHIPTVRPAESITRSFAAAVFFCRGNIHSIDIWAFTEIYGLHAEYAVCAWKITREDRRQSQAYTGFKSQIWQIIQLFKIKILIFENWCCWLKSCTSLCIL